MLDQITGIARSETNKNTQEPIASLIFSLSLSLSI